MEIELSLITGIWNKIAGNAPIRLAGEGERLKIASLVGG